MRRQKFLRVVAGIVFTLSFVSPLLSRNQVLPVANAFTARSLMHGSQGYDVYELQNRLHFIGYYHGKIDGIFGWQTYWSVRNFQSQFGLPVTGLVNLKTKQKLVAATAGWHNNPANKPGGTSPKSGGTRPKPGGSSPSQFSTTSTVPIPVASGLNQPDLRLMQHVVYGEARGEPFEGQVAIAAVILNRLRDPRFPHTVPGIVYQPGAFTAVADGQVNLQPDATAMRAVVDALHGWDPSHGAVYYFNPATATSAWMWSRPQIVKIGKHIFCR